MVTALLEQRKHKSICIRKCQICHIVESSATTYSHRITPLKIRLLSFYLTYKKPDLRNPELITFLQVFKMKFRKWNSVLSLRSEQTWYSVCVKAQAIWKGINRKTNEFRGFNILFIDEQVINISL